jgi:hypothetical protein
MELGATRVSLQEVELLDLALVQPERCYLLGVRRPGQDWAQFSSATAVRDDGAASFGIDGVAVVLDAVIA